MHRGYVKLWRKCLDSGLLQNADAWQFMSWCLLKATHKPRTQVVGNQVVPLQKGEFIFGRKAAAKELNSTEQRIRSCLKILEKIEFINQQSTNKFTIISIVNWDTYQGEQPTNNQQITNKQPTNNQQITTNKHVKHEKNEEHVKNIPPSPLKGASDKKTLVDVILQYSPSEKLVEALKGFVEMRNASKSKLTLKALELSLKKLDSFNYTEQQKIQCVEECVINGWKSFYPLKNLTPQEGVMNFGKFLQERENETRDN